MINIKVLKDYAEVSYEIPNTGRKQTKIVGLSDISSLFDTKISFDSGILPVFGEVNTYGVQRIIQRDSSYIVLIQGINPFVNTLHRDYHVIPADIKKKLKIDHITTDLKELVHKHTQSEAHVYNGIYYPNILMSLHLKKSTAGFKIQHSGLLAYKDHFINDDTILYDFPYSNTHKGSSTGDICWGGNDPRVVNVTQAVGVIHTFLGSVMNRDLYHPIKIGSHDVASSAELLAYMAHRAGELTAFPYADVPLRKSMKYGDVISYMSQNWK